jgi:hypothetical protein
MNHVPTEIAQEYHVICRGRHLKVSRHDGRDGITWDLLYQVKNAVWGPDAAAIEFYPPFSQLMNVGNYRHLWRVDGIPWLFNLRPPKSLMPPTPDDPARRIMELERQRMTATLEVEALKKRLPLPPQIADIRTFFRLARRYRLWQIEVSRFPSRDRQWPARYRRYRRLVRHRDQSHERMADLYAKIDRQSAFFASYKDRMIEVMKHSALGLPIPDDVSLECDL